MFGVTGPFVIFQNESEPNFQNWEMTGPGPAEIRQDLWMEFHLNLISPKKKLEKGLHKHGNNKHPVESVATK